MFLLDSVKLCDKHGKTSRGIHHKMTYLLLLRHINKHSLQQGFMFLIKSKINSPTIFFKPKKTELAGGLLILSNN